MDNLYHKSIKSFTIEGIIKDDASIGRLREKFTRLKIEEMRELGYVQRLDIDPNFTIKYNSTEEYFEFILTTYGTYTGRKQAEWIYGIDGTLVVPTQKNKSNELSQDQESQSNQK